VDVRTGRRRKGRICGRRWKGESYGREGMLRDAEEDVRKKKQSRRLEQLKTEEENRRIRGKGE
jgi:hypothetical protein